MESSGGLEWARVCYAVDGAEEGSVAVKAERQRGRVVCTRVTLAEAARGSSAAGGPPVAACLSPRESFTCRLEAPFPSFHKFRKVLPTLLDIQVPFPLEECVYSFVDILRGTGGRGSALAVAARMADVRKKLEGLQGSGLDPFLLDHEGLALWTETLAAFPVLPAEKSLLRAVIFQSGARRTLVIGRGSDFVESHSIPENDSGAAGRFLRAHGEPGRDTVRWILVAGRDSKAASDPMIRTLTAEWPGPVSTVEDPETFLARAVAVRALTPGLLRCNLRSGPLAHATLTVFPRRKMMQSAVLLLVSGLLLSAGNLFLQAGLRRHGARLDKKFHELAFRLAGPSLQNARGEYALLVVRRVADARVQTLAPFTAMLEPSLTEPIAALMVFGREQGLLYDTFSVNRNQILINGTAPDWSRCEKLRDKVRQMGFPAEIRILEAQDDERIPFTLSPGGGA